MSALSCCDWGVKTAPATPCAEEDLSGAAGAARKGAGLADPLTLSWLLHGLLKKKTVLVKKQNPSCCLAVFDCKLLLGV